MVNCAGPEPFNLITVTEFQAQHIMLAIITDPDQIDLQAYLGVL